MSSATAVPLITPVLANGGDIEYKAFVRHFQNQSFGELFLAVTCRYGTPGFSIFFKPTASGFALLQQTPTGPEPEHVAYYSACWNSGLQESVPSHVLITDAFGTHSVPVQTW